ncbi:hypothetical protein C2G38_2158147 [Gigaspora rosea]|uniref:Uncharacterized protein n=1 Tax=Gigaspora rosea TaxID=44941 RepID=A0A397W0U9_9GLOM|nr:hypothetical protein C2G38_2158147 [Gigaspora rosea]
MKEKLRYYFQEKEKIDSVLVYIFLILLKNIEKKMDQNFFALHRKIEEDNLLEEHWFKVKLSKPYDQHKYKFLTKNEKCIDKAIKMLSGLLKKEFDNIKEEI